MGNYLQVDAKTPADALMFYYGIHMANYEMMKPFFQDAGEEEYFEDAEDYWLAMEVFRDAYRRRCSEDPSVA